MFCPQCGTECADGQAFCTNCGAALIIVAAAPPAPAYSAPPPAKKNKAPLIAAVAVTAVVLIVAAILFVNLFVGEVDKGDLTGTYSAQIEITDYDLHDEDSLPADKRETDCELSIWLGTAGVGYGYLLVDGSFSSELYVYMEYGILHLDGYWGDNYLTFELEPKRRGQTILLGGTGDCTMTDGTLYFDLDAVRFSSSAGDHSDAFLSPPLPGEEDAEEPPSYLDTEFLPGDWVSEPYDDGSCACFSFDEDGSVYVEYATPATADAGWEDWYGDAWQIEGWDEGPYTITGNWLAITLYDTGAEEYYADIIDPMTLRLTRSDDSAITLHRLG